MVNTRSKRNADTLLATGDIIASPPKRKRTSKQIKQDQNKDKDVETTSTPITETAHDKISNKNKERGRGRMKKEKNASIETENAADRSHAEAHAQAALLAEPPTSTSQSTPSSTSDQTSTSSSTLSPSTSASASASDPTSTLAPPSTSASASTSTTRPVSISPLPRETLNITKPSLYEFLTTNTVAQLLQEKPKKQMVTIEHNATLRTCIERMAEANVLSLPMVSGISIEDTELAEDGDGSDESGQFMGNLDVSAIVHAFIQHIDAYGSDPFHIRQFWDRLCITVHSNDADVSVLMKTEENCTLRELIHQCFFHTLSNKVPLNSSPSNKPSSAPSSETQNNALPSRDDAIPLGYVHRVAVFDGKGRVRDIISQTDLIRYLASHLSSYGSPLLSQTIEELGFGQREVYTIPNTMTAMAALRTVDHQEWTGLAIVDQKKHLVGSLTTNDLRGLTMSDMDHVLEPICDWLKRIATHQHREGLPVQYVIPDHTIQQCIDGMLLDGVHRLYVVESYHNPIPTGVITLTDLLELLFTHY